MFYDDDDTVICISCSAEVLASLVHEHEKVQHFKDYRRRWEFPNGFGASVVRNKFSYGNKSGLYELAVLDSKGDISYDTYIASDVLGYLTPREVVGYIKMIASLKKEES